MTDLSALIELVEHRIGQDFDGECHLTEAEARQIAAALREMQRFMPTISFDGTNVPNEHRLWLARQLLDSKLDDEEAYGIVAYHPAITDIRNTQAERRPE